MNILFRFSDEIINMGCTSRPYLAYMKLHELNCRHCSKGCRHGHEENACSHSSLQVYQLHCPRVQMILDYFLNFCPFMICIYFPI